MDITAKKVHTIEWDGSEEEYIELGEHLARERGEQGLDSHDAGDATGEVLAWTKGLDYRKMIFRGRVLEVVAIWDTFEYEGKWAQ